MVDSDSDSDLELAIIGFFSFACQTTIAWAEAHYNKIPHHTSALSGVAWVDELMNRTP